MGLISQMMASNSLQANESLPADNDFWYTDVSSGVASTGQRISRDAALRISTVWRCVQAIAADIAAMPLIMYRRLPNDEGKERARNHPLYDLLHDQPNESQTAYEWRENMMVHLLLTGNAYSRIETGPRGLADSLAVPFNPDRMKVERVQVPGRPASTGRLKYTYNNEQGKDEVYREDQIFHLRGLSSDGLKGLSVVAYARNSIGLGMATEDYGARFFGQGSNPGGVLEMDGTLSSEGASRMASRWERAHRGLSGAHKIAVLERGVKWKQVSMNNDDSQFLQTRSFQVEDIARWFGVPLHRIGHNEKSTSWGTGIEQFNLGYIQYTLIPWMVRWEQTILKDLILFPDRFFAQFLPDHLMRGDQRSRFVSYQSAINAGWMSRNEVRKRENLNPEEGLDEFLQPKNMGIAGEEEDEPDFNQNPFQQPGQQQPPNNQEDEEEEEQNGESQGADFPWEERARALAHDSAARVVRKEVAAIQKAARRFESSPLDFHAWVDDFYSKHEEFVIESLGLNPVDAAEYIALQRDAVIYSGPETVNTWNGQQADFLADRILDRAKERSSWVSADWL